MVSSGLGAARLLQRKRRRGLGAEEAFLVASGMCSVQAMRCIVCGGPEDGEVKLRLEEARLRVNRAVLGHKGPTCAKARVVLSCEIRPDKSGAAVQRFDLCTLTPEQPSAQLDFSVRTLCIEEAASVSLFCRAEAPFQVTVIGDVVGDFCIVGQ